MDKPELIEIGTFPDWDRAPLDRMFTVHRPGESADPAALLAEVGPRVRAIAVRAELAVPAALMLACPKLEIVSVHGVGVDGVDLAHARAHGIRVANTPLLMVDDVADLALGMALALSRRMMPAEAHVRSGAWATQGNFALSRKFSGSRAGILGLGAIGMAIARRLQGFGCEIAYSSRAPKPGAEAMAFLPDPLALAGWSDFLFVCVAATPETRHVIDAAVLRTLGPEGHLINVSRAANIDEGALLDALETGGIAGAALDVFRGEPRVDPRFARLPNVVLQPHLGSATVETRKAMARMMRDNLAAHFAGRPLLSEVR